VGTVPVDVRKQRSEVIYLKTKKTQMYRQYVLTLYLALKYTLDSDLWFVNLLLHHYELYILQLKHNLFH